MKAIILARVSTEEQADKGNSLPAQEERLKSYCIRKGFEVSKLFSFDESAYKTNRSEFDKMLDYLELQHEKVVVCFDKVDRFSRNVFDKRVSILFDLAMQDKIELHFASDNLTIHSKISATEKFQFSMNLGLAKYYSDAISDNVIRVYEKKLNNGEWIGAAPLGYLNVNCEEQRLSGKMTNYKKEVQKILFEKHKGENYTYKRIEIDPIKGPMIKKVFEDAASGNYSLSMIQRKMGEMGLMGKTGNLVSKSCLVNILTNPFYYGAMRSKKEIYQGNHEPIINEALFDLAQEKLHDRNKPIKKRWNFAFTGLMRCGNCGCAITAEKKKDKYVYYHCTGMKNQRMKHPCRQPLIREKDLIKILGKQVKRVQIDDMVRELLMEAIKQSHKQEKNLHQKGLQEWEVMYKQAEDKLNRLLELFLAGAITQTEFSDKKKQIMANKDRASHHLNSHGEAQKAWVNYSEKLIITTNHVYEMFKEGTPEEVKLLMKAIGTNYVLKDGNVTFEFKQPFNFVVGLNELKSSNKSGAIRW